MNYDTLINAGIVLAVLLALGLLGAWTERHRERVVRTSRTTPITLQETIEHAERELQGVKRLERFTQFARIVAYIGIPLGTILLIGIDETVDFVVRWWRPLAFLLLAVCSGLAVFYIGQYLYAPRKKWGKWSSMGRTMLRRRLIFMVAAAVAVIAVGISAYEILRASLPVEAAATFVLVMKAATMTLLGGGLVGAAKFLVTVRYGGFLFTILFYGGLGLLAYGFYLFVSS